MYIPTLDFWHVLGEPPNHHWFKPPLTFREVLMAQKLPSAVMQRFNECSTGKGIIWGLWEMKRWRNVGLNCWTIKHGWSLLHNTGQFIGVRNRFRSCFSILQELFDWIIREQGSLRINIRDPTDWLVVLSIELPMPMDWGAWSPVIQHPKKTRRPGTTIFALRGPASISIS